jgi:hypothetical protein
MLPMPIQRLLKTAAIVLAGCVAAHTSGGAIAQTFNLKQLEVKQGSLDFGVSNSVQWGLPSNDLNRTAHEVGIDYGLRNWWRISGVAKPETPADDNFRIARAALENIFVLKAIDDKRLTDIGFGWFAAVEASMDRATTNAVVFGPILAVKLDKLALNTNSFLEQTFGRNKAEGIALNYGWQAKYELREGFAVGIEGFGVIENLGDPLPWSEQEHRIGPAIFTEIALTRDFKIAPDIGLLFGMTRATPDVALKLNIGVPLN